MLLNNHFNLINFIKKFLVLIVSILIYYLIYHFVTTYYTKGIGIAYNSVGLAAKNISISKYIESLDYFFASYINYFYYPNSHNSTFIRVINIVYIALDLLLVIKIIVSKKIGIKNIFIIIFLLLCLLIGINFQTVLISHYHMLIIFSFSLFYIYSFVLEEISNSKNRIYKFLLIVISILLIWDNIIYSNEMSLKKELDANVTLSTYTRLISDIEEVEGYEIGKTPVALLGNLNESPISKDREGFKHDSYTNSSNFSVLNDYNKESYISSYLNYPIAFVDNNKKQEIINSDIYKSMPCYPNKGSIILNEGILIIKLSND